jgi:transposase
MMDPKARARAEAILKVRSGQMTATEAAKMLGISRQQYYQWEQRALSAMLTSLEDQPTGRPPTPKDPEKETLQRRVEQLQEQVQQQEQREQLRQILDQWERDNQPPSKKNPK